MSQIKVKDLFKIFGPASGIDKALEMARNGKDRNEIKKETDCVVAVNNVTLEVEKSQIFVIKTILSGRCGRIPGSVIPRPRSWPIKCRGIFQVWTVVSCEAPN